MSCFEVCQSCALPLIALISVEVLSLPMVAHLGLWCSADGSWPFGLEVGIPPSRKAQMRAPSFARSQQHFYAMFYEPLKQRARCIS